MRRLWSRDLKNIVTAIGSGEFKYAVPVLPIKTPPKSIVGQPLRVVACTAV